MKQGKKNAVRGGSRSAVRRGVSLLFRAAALVCAVWLACGERSSVYAAQSSVIESLTVTFKSTFGEQEEILEPQITVSGNGCTLSDYQYQTEFENWKAGKKVRVEITVRAPAGKIFPMSLTRSACKVTGADFVSAKALDDTTLQVKVDYRPVMVLGDTEAAGWSNAAKKKASWKAVDCAPGYTITLYGDNKVVKRLNVEKNSIDLSEYMKDMDKTYYYEVKAIPLTSDDKKYFKAGNPISSSDQVFDWEDVMEEEVKSSDDGGSLKGDNYILPNGSKVTNSWKKVLGNWYYFDGNGNSCKGWASINGHWYYMDSKGVMQTGWQKGSNDSWFYLAPGGDMQTGWVQTDPGKWYYMDSSGYMQRGWVNADGRTFYMGQSGEMLTGWQMIDGAWYYFNTFSDGTRGAMYVNRTTPDGYYVNERGVWVP